MRAIEYGVAMSLDGYIAGPNREYDWIVSDPEVDKALAEAWSRFDGFLMGRLTWEVVQKNLGTNAFAGKELVVASRTLPATPGVRIVPDLTRAVLDELKAQGGGDIWLFGGGNLFRHVLALGAVDRLSLGIIPVLLGGSVPLLPPPPLQTRLRLRNHRVFPSGIALMDYDVVYSADETTPRSAEA